MPEWVATLIVAAFGAACGSIGFLIGQDRRITRLEERVRSLGQQLGALPKRRGD
jgi:hypothetical protein